jgi:hypothetical protein
MIQLGYKVNGDGDARLARRLSPTGNDQTLCSV